MKFLRCEHCGNLVTFMEDSGVFLVCCGEPMKQLTAHTADQGKEKHVPVVTVAGREVCVQVGDVLHPMEKDHLIQWIVLETCCGSYIKKLEPGEEPKASFTMREDEKALCVYEYCNKHGLWKTDVK